MHDLVCVLWTTPNNAYIIATSMQAESLKLFEHRAVVAIAAQARLRAQTHRTARAWLDNMACLVLNTVICLSCLPCLNWPCPFCWGLVKLFYNHSFASGREPNFQLLQQARSAQCRVTSTFYHTPSPVKRPWSRARLLPSFLGHPIFPLSPSLNH